MTSAKSPNKKSSKRTSTLMKNWTATSTPNAAPTHTGERRRRTKSSSTQPMIRGIGASSPKLGWASARLTSTNGENPKKSPPAKAATDHTSQRRRSQNMASADSGGDSTSMTFNDATGPNSQVIGAAAIPSPSELGAMLMPTGTNSFEE